MISGFSTWWCQYDRSFASVLLGNTTSCFSLSPLYQFYACKLIILINLMLLIDIIQVRSKSLYKLLCLESHSSVTVICTIRMASDNDIICQDFSPV